MRWDFAQRRGAAAAGLGGLAVLVCLLGGAATLRADYVDPWGLPSGSASLKLATQEAIALGDTVQGFDFATGSVDSSGSYAEIIAGGTVDLVFFELDPDSTRPFFRSPEDIHSFDRYLVVGFEDSLALEEIVHMEGVELIRFAPVEDGFAFVLLQIQQHQTPETTAVKLEVTSLGDSTVAFDWVWQPNGSRQFIPTAAGECSLSELKALYR